MCHALSRLGFSQHLFKRLGIHRASQTLAIFQNDGRRASDFVLLTKRQVAVDHLCIALPFWRRYIVNHPIVPNFVAILRTPDVLRFGGGIRPQNGVQEGINRDVVDFLQFRLKALTVNAIGIGKTASLRLPLPF